MLDVQVVKIDGTVLWASEELDLLGALRGTFGAFAVVVCLQTTLLQISNESLVLSLLLPNTAPVRKHICDDILSMDVGQPNPKVGLFLYQMNYEIMKAIGDGKNGNMIVVYSFDARSEESGRKEFEWALSVPGAIDRTRYQTKKELAMM